MDTLGHSPMPLLSVEGCCLWLFFPDCASPVHPWLSGPLPNPGTSQYIACFGICWSSVHMEQPNQCSLVYLYTLSIFCCRVLVMTCSICCLVLRRDINNSLPSLFHHFLLLIAYCFLISHCSYSSSSLKLA